MILVPSFGQLLQSFSTCFTEPSFATFVTLLTGWVFARRHTVTGGILAADSAADKHHSAYHRFFAAARWSLSCLGAGPLDTAPALLRAGRLSGHR
jgi:hypothetical protein